MSCLYFKISNILLLISAPSCHCLMIINTTVIANVITKHTYIHLSMTTVNYFLERCYEDYAMFHS